MYSWGGSDALWDFGEVCSLDLAIGGGSCTHLQMMMKNLRSSSACPRRGPWPTHCASLWLSTCSTSRGSTGISDSASSGLTGAGGGK